MSEIAENQPTEEAVVESSIPEEMQAQMAALQKEVESLRDHSQKLLNEKKQQQAKAREAMEQARAAEEDKARKSGDLEQLNKSYQQRIEELLGTISEFENRDLQQKINSAARDLAMSQASDPGRARLLAKEIAERLVVSEGELRVKNENGELTIDGPEKLVQSMKENDNYKFLFDGSKATGGGAQGNDSSAADNKTMSRADFDKLDAMKKATFIKKGGTLFD